VEVDDPAITVTERTKLRHLKRQLLRDMNEMTGHLVTRSRVQVDTGPALTSEIAGFDAGTWLAELAEAEQVKSMAERVESRPAATEPAVAEPESEPGEDANVRPFAR
jgi:hypothetical protein